MGLWLIKRDVISQIHVNTLDCFFVCLINAFGKTACCFSFSNALDRPLAIRVSRADKLNSFDNKNAVFT